MAKKRAVKKKSSKKSTKKRRKKITISDRAKESEQKRGTTINEKTITSSKRKIVSSSKMLVRRSEAIKRPVSQIRQTVPIKQISGRSIIRDTKDRIPTGIPGYDQMINGGYENRSINLVAGGGGSGKSIFALQFLVEGIKRGENVLYVTFEEKKEDFYTNMKEMGYNLEKVEATGKFIFVEYSPEKVKMMLDEGGGAIESTVLKNNIKRMVVDSLSSFSLLFDDESSRRQAILGLFGMIRKWHITSLFTVQYNPSDKEDQGLSYLEFEADSITLLYYLSSRGTRQRFLEVLKMRGTDHSKDVHVFKVMRGGIKVGPRAPIR